MCWQRHVRRQALLERIAKRDLSAYKVSDKNRDRIAKCRYIFASG